MFKYTLDNKRYHTLNYFFKNKFGQKVIKVPIDLGSNCPNQDKGGCIYCSNKSKANIIIDTTDYIEQFKHTKDILEQKWPNSLYIPYFQSGTNTSLDVEVLKPLITKLLALPKVVGIAIATRPDSISPKWYDYLRKLNEQTFLMIELSLQSSNNNTLNFINRGHTKEVFKEAVDKLHQDHIFVVAHIINGLPYENKKDMLNTVSFLNDLKIDALKIHMLYIEKNTPLAKIYEKNKFPILSKDEYIDIVINQLELLKDTVVIERLTGDPLKSDLITPTWLLKKFVVLNDIDKEMVKRDTYQGKRAN